MGDSMDVWNHKVGQNLRIERIREATKVGETSKKVQDSRLFNSIQ